MQLRSSIKEAKELYWSKLQILLKKILQKKYVTLTGQTNIIEHSQNIPKLGAFPEMVGEGIPQISLTFREITVRYK